MASKSKRARMAPKENLQRKFLLWAIAVFFVKLAIIFRIQGMNAGSGDRVYFVDGAWLGADGENYLMGYNALLKDGVFSTESILNYWPAGYPLVLLFLSILGKSWALTTLSIVQSAIFSYAAYFFASQISKTRLKKFAFLAFLLVIFNPTLSLSSIAVGYESFTASGILIVVGLIIKDFIEKDDKKFFKYLIISSIVVGILSFMQPRLIVTGILLNVFWIITRKGVKASSLAVVITLVVTLFFPATLVYRNNQAIGINSISTNLGVTMNIGAGDNATGGYMKEGYGVECDLSGTSAQQDNQRTRCVLNWYLNNPTKAIELFYNKSVYFWSPWYGPSANGTMARNPWLTINPLKNIATTQDGFNIVYGGFGKVISWLWLLGGLTLLLYGYFTLWRHNLLEKFIGNLAMVAITTNWLITLFTIGDHRFRIPIMGVSLFLQAIGLKTLFSGGKAPMVDGPALR
ncbi:hypothetical protein B1s21122_05950 [Candidatus Nanopelagicus limnes]|uniref:Glycosyltransferase RgtA/B/C/D-like domain-containing protein n=1 Tax=Candidatus Nanopelagicus limnae TaxID=1884634 RepID=A0A249JZ76_9ACTN|nr:hypothetical protein [Candidatus Nanopelagicus limnes]ASY09848.1 hypothetical protein B1s21122_05950 [Candidatus Nanopelagicus limnes]